MKTPIHIKGKRLWAGCAFILTAIIFTFCHTKITTVEQPEVATVGDVVPITVNIEMSTNSSGNEHMVIGVLLPKGWKGIQNLTGTYTSNKGDGNLIPIPLTNLAAHSNGLNWPNYMMTTFGLAGNLINDMEWVALQTDVSFPFANNDKINGAFHLKLKVGADDNPTMVKLAYVVANTGNGFSSDGFTDAGYGPTAEYYNEFIGSCFSVTGGSGDLVDFCNPQLTSVDPPKSLDNDIITLTYNNNIITTGLAGSPAVYLCATAITNDGKTISVCEQTDKTKLVQKPAGGGIYQLTFWPRAFFGVTDAQTIVSITYFLTNADGSIKVGYGNTDAPFTYKFKCT